MQAIQWLTAEWIDDRADTMEQIATERYGWSSADTIPCSVPSAKEAPNDNNRRASREGLTPSLIWSWKSRPHVSMLFHGELAYEMSLWTDHLWRVAAPDELCGASKRMMHRLQCINEKHRKELVNYINDLSESEPDENADEGQYDQNAFAPAPSAEAVHSVPLHPRLMAFYNQCIKEWLAEPIGDVVAACEDQVMHVLLERCQQIEN